LTGLQDYGFLYGMKATIDIPDELYRQVKAKSALQGRCVREVAVNLFDAWVHAKRPDATPGEGETAGSRKPAWFGTLRKYADRADGRHDMHAVRASVARGRARTQA
jgi:hypothetical protein